MKPDLETRVRMIEDELAIRSLAARFSDCANERDYDGFAELWQAKGIWEIGPPLETRAVGVDDIVTMLKRLLKPQLGFMQMTHAGVVWLNGDRATARFVEREHGFGRGSSSNGTDCFYENLAVYNDELVREIDGKWRFAKRTYVYRYLDASPFNGEVFALKAALSGKAR